MIYNLFYEKWDPNPSCGNKQWKENWILRAQLEVASGFHSFLTLLPRLPLPLPSRSSILMLFWKPSELLQKERGKHITPWVEFCPWSFLITLQTTQADNNKSVYRLMSARWADLQFRAAVAGFSKAFSTSSFLTVWKITFASHCKKDTPSQISGSLLSISPASRRAFEPRADLGWGWGGVVYPIYAHP